MHFFLRFFKDLSLLLSVLLLSLLFFELEFSHLPFLLDPVALSALQHGFFAPLEFNRNRVPFGAEEVQRVALVYVLVHDLEVEGGALGLKSEYEEKASVTPQLLVFLSHFGLGGLLVVEERFEGLIEGVLVVASELDGLQAFANTEGVIGFAVKRPSKGLSYGQAAPELGILFFSVLSDLVFADAVFFVLGLASANR